MHARKLIAVAALVAVGATACGASSKSSSPTSTSSASSAPSAAGSTTAPRASHGSGDGSFCDLFRHLGSAASNPSIGAKTPTDLKAIYEQLPQELQQAQAAVPSAIKGDFATFVKAEDQVVSALAKANYDPTKISAATFAGLDTARLAAASARISQYMAKTCGAATPTT